MYAAYSAALFADVERQHARPRAAARQRGGCCGSCSCRPSSSGTVSGSRSAAPRRRAAATADARASARCCSQRPMIAKQRDRRHPPRERRERTARIGILPRGAARGDAREVGGPRHQPIDRAREPRACARPCRPRRRARRAAAATSRRGSASAASHARRSVLATPASACDSAASGAPPACGEHELGLGHALRREPRARLRSASAAAPRAAGSATRSSAARRPGESDTRIRYVPARRLLERLQERVGRRRIHALGRRDDGDLRALAMARELRRSRSARGRDRPRSCRPACSVARLRRSTRAVRAACRSGCCAGDRVAAARARAARETVGARRFAQQRLREIERERVLADAARAVDQQRVRPALARARGRSIAAARAARAGAAATAARSARDVVARARLGHPRHPRRSHGERRRVLAPSSARTVVAAAACCR